MNEPGMNTQQFDTRAASAWDQGQPAEQAGEEFPLLDYVQQLWFRKRLIIAITLFVAVVGWIHVNQIKSVYTATSTLMIGVPQSNVVDIEAVLTRDVYGDEILGALSDQQNQAWRRLIDAPTPEEAEALSYMCLMLPSRPG